ncbi:MAG: DNA polymerase I, partial [Rhodospirillales bacterium]|nr:DNA polymerase I [Rhodospirillales bacterium]
KAFNVCCLELQGFEADDLIATYAKAAAAKGAKVTIVSSDKDLMQLVGDGIEMLDPIKNKAITAVEVMEKFGVPPAQVVDVQALAGDPTDNVPGVPGIGIKTAAQLITEYGDLETLLSQAVSIKQPKRRESLLANADKARLSRQLVELRQDAPVPEPLEAMAVRGMDKAVLAEFLRHQGFKSVLQRFENKLGAAPASASASGAATPEAPEPQSVDYELVTDLDTLRRWIAEAREKGVVAVDTETTSLHALTCEIVGLSLSTEPRRACYIPLKHGAGSEIQGSLDLSQSGEATVAPALIPKHQALAELKELLEDPCVLKVGHNIKYDLHVLHNQGITVAPIDDTMMLSYVLDGATHGHGMDELSSLHLNHKTITFAEVCGTGKARITFDKVPLDRALAYAAEDADVTLRLHRLFRSRLVAERMVTVYETLERPLIAVLAAMERHGIRIDPDFLRTLSEDFEQRLRVLEAEIHDLA